MSIVRNNFYIITGGPGSGKTTLIEALKSFGFSCIPEVARQIIQEQIKIGGDALHDKDNVKFCDLMISRSIYTFDEVKENDKPVFFDRGIPELIGYCRLIKVDVPDYLRNAARLYRYNKKVFILPPWKEIYRTDAERKQTWEEAIETYQNILDSYLELGYQPVEVPSLPIQERADFVLKHIDGYSY